MNQDTLGSRQKCERRAKQILLQGGRVVVDRYVGAIDHDFEVLLPSSLATSKEASSF